MAWFARPASLSFATVCAAALTVLPLGTAQEPSGLAPFEGDPDFDDAIDEVAWESATSVAGGVGCTCPSCGTQAPPAGPSRTCKTCCHGLLLDWSKYPETIDSMPRPGIFPIAPTQGPAHFSMWDAVTGRCRPAPPKSGYAPFAINAWPLYDADWRFVEGIDPCERTLVERLKRIHKGDCLLFSTGGEYWTRYHDEQNSRLTDVENTFTLHHVRLFGDMWYRDGFRLYGEYVWADSFGEELPPVPPDVDRGDLMDLFIDVKLFDYQCRPVYVRAGRQELQYGSQRLITPLPWANKRHSFDGVKVFRQGENWDFDAFWTQFVPPNADEVDRADSNQTFVGAWLTNRPKKGETLDYYYLMLDNDNASAPLGIAHAPLEAHTFGTRWAGDNCGWLWDFEGALQFGEQGGSDLFAGMGTAGVGRSWKNARLSPTVWLYYDYASGDDDPTAGDAHTFNSLFPFGHHYLGWMDLVGRRNIHDLNAHLYLYPAPWITFWFQYHRFWLDEAQDALYNPGGVAYRQDATGLAGTDVGDEINFVVNFHLTRYSDLLVSYNRLYGGGFLEATSGPGLASDAESLYMLFQQRW